MKFQKDFLLSQVNQFPHQPGVYLMKGVKGQILYVGKARDLQKRVKSYFSRQASSKIAALLKHVVQIEYIITSSEKEALLLECNLIKTHKPRYNVVLRDDKNYPYLRVDLRESWPRFTVVRRMQKDGARYFGPFASAKAVRETLKSMERIFPLRKCGDFVFKNRTRPCLNYQIGKCTAPCMGYISEEAYRKIAEEACLFLEGKAQGLLATLETEMKKAAAALEFERAAFYRDRIYAIKHTLEKQTMVSPDFIHRDVLAFMPWPDKDKIEILVLQVRNGYLLGERQYTLALAAARPPEAFIHFLSQYYYREDFVPREIVLPFLPEEKAVLEEWLAEKAGEPVKIVLPQKEEQKRLLEMAQLNLKHRLAMKLAEKDPLQELRRVLCLSALPRRIECFDISNIQGQHSVASMVVFVDAKPAKEEYRRYKLHLEGTPDDYAMMYEALKRRFEKLAVLPDLLVIDGGRGQLNIALTVLKEVQRDIPVIALAKGKERKEDKIYLPKRKNPIRLKATSPALKLLKQLRDEAHRFAISYYKRLHRKTLLDSVLDKVPGIGPKRKALLWQHFNSLEEIKKADTKLLCQLGLPRRVAKKLKETIITI
ncbi:MAG: excinuclease ABC subunit UvrC [Candidatus Desulfofervidaceae bacterium]|nr:excinuclease ABC subunit UvrC [Candidatus Desulfofervidaceae bacterium]